jgi:Na+(H+)/acetate symporter ActP
MRGSFTAAMVANALVTIAFGSLLMAFFPAVLISMYYDLMLRKEGADLAGRVDALTPR